MKFNDTSPVIVPAKLAVLLVFLPPESTDRPLRHALVRLIDSLNQRLGGTMRVLKIDETTHPDVVRSFDISHLPAFVLVRQGVELWRFEGITDEETLTKASRQVLAA